MNKLRLFFLLFLIFFSVVLWADIATPQDRCNSISHIKGFKKYTKTKFYVIHIGFWPSLTFSKITADTMEVGNGSLYNQQYLSWDPKLNSLKPGKSKADVIGIDFSNDPPDHKNASKRMTMALGSPQFQEFDRMDSYYEIVPGTGKGDPKYVLKLYKRIYKNQDFTIYETGDFDKFAGYLSKQQNQGWFRNADLSALVDYAKSLENHKVIFDQK
jgi:hypothetical protein